MNQRQIKALEPFFKAAEDCSRFNAHKPDDAGVWLNAYLTLAQPRELLRAFGMLPEKDPGQ